ncbi:MAG: hypothetical protein EA397_06830 [Deltaproteobacteria bacterium]|nr:MAG: hypothetical protein EA397_06830 [Deltaproteobacteria bacterium]
MLRTLAPLPILLAALALACEDPASQTELPDLPDESDSWPSGGFDSDVEFPTDTGVAPDGREPDHWLYIYQLGSFQLPDGEAGEPPSLLGELVVYEFVDYALPSPEDDEDEDTDSDPVDSDSDPVDSDPVDSDPVDSEDELRPWELLEDDPLHCEVVYTMAGEPSEHPCDGCDLTYEITFTVTEGDPGPCFDPDLPADGAVLRIGWSWSEGIAYYDYANVGVWTPWFWIAEREVEALEGDSDSGVPTEPPGPPEYLLTWTDVIGVSLEPEEDT